MCISETCCAEENSFREHIPVCLINTYPMMYSSHDIKVFCVALLRWKRWLTSTSHHVVYILRVRLGAQRKPCVPCWQCGSNRRQVSSGCCHCGIRRQNRNLVLFCGTNSPCSRPSSPRRTGTILPATSKEKQRQAAGLRCLLPSQENDTNTVTKGYSNKSIST